MCASQNLVNVGRSGARLLQLIDSIRDQAAALGIEAERIDRRQIVSSCQTDNEIAPGRRQRARCHDEPAWSELSRCRQRCAPRPETLSFPFEGPRLQSRVEKLRS